MQNRTMSITVATDDEVALRALGRAMMEMAGQPGALDVPPPAWMPNPHIDGPATFAQAAPAPYEYGVSEVVAEVSGNTGIPASVFAPPTPTGPYGDIHTECPGAYVAPLEPPPVHSVTAAAPPLQPAPTGDLDKNGLPWDMRINTSNKAKTQQGVWKRKPGLSDDDYNAVIAELRGVMAAPAAPVVAPVPTPPVAVVAPPAPVAVPSAPPVQSAPVPAPPVQPAPVAAPPVATDSTVPATFPDLLQHITKHRSAGLINMDQVNAVCAEFGVAQVSLLSARADLIPSVYARLCQVWGAGA